MRLTPTMVRSLNHYAASMMARLRFHRCQGQVMLTSYTVVCQNSIFSVSPCLSGLPYRPTLPKFQRSKSLQSTSRNISMFILFDPPSRKPMMFGAYIETYSRILYKMISFKEYSRLQHAVVCRILSTIIFPS